MELVFQKTPINCLDTLLSEVASTEQTQEIKLTEAMPDIGRIIDSFGQIIVRSKQWGAQNISLTGGVMAWVLYAPEDGSTMRCMDAWIPFQMNWDLSENGPDGEIRACVMLRSIDARVVSARKIVLRAGIGAMAQAFAPMDALISEAADIPDDVALLKNTYPMRLTCEVGEKNFLIDEDITAINAEKLLTYTLIPQITEEKVMGNKAVFRGNGNLHLRYLDTDGALRCADFELPFSQFAELSGIVGPDATVNVDGFVTSLDVRLGEAGSIRVKGGVTAQYQVDDRVTVCLPEDAYSPHRAVQTHFSSVVLPVSAERYCTAISCEQSVPADAKDVIDSAFYPDFPRVRMTEGNAYLELQGTFHTLYTAEDGTLRAVNARWEGSHTVPADDAVRIEAMPVTIAHPQVRIGEGMLEAQTSLSLTISTTLKTPMQMLECVTLGELQEPDYERPSVILRRAGGMRLWDIAKACASTVEAIREANDLKYEPAPNQMLLIPIK